MRPHELSVARDKWAMAVGRAILAFGDVERVTHECLFGLLPRDAFACVARLRFPERADLVLALFRSGTASQERIQDLEKLLGQAKELAKVRNVIAHNPMEIGVYEDDAGRLHLKDEMARYRDATRVYSLADIEAYAQGAEHLSLDLREVAQSLRKPPPRASED